MDLDDVSLIELHVRYEYGEEGVITDPLLLLAGDLDANDAVDLDDVSLIELHVRYEYGESGLMTQREIAELYA